MVEDKQVIEQEESNLPSEVDSSKQLLDKINGVTTSEELQDVANLFNLNITKKELARGLLQDELLDLVLKQAGERLKKRPDELSTKDLLDYMNAFQNNLARTQTYVDRVENNPTIQVNDNKQVVVNINNLSREGLDNVEDVVNELIQSLSSTQSLEDLVDSVKVVDVSGGDTNDD